MKTIRRLAHALLATMLAAACSESTAPIPDPLTGEWNYSEYMQVGPEDACSASGNVLLTQSGVTFAGTAMRSGFGCNFTPDTIVVSAGSVSDSVVTFTLGVCPHTGTFNAAHDSIAGTFTCPPPTPQVTGTWRAAKVGAAATLTLVPGGRTMVPGGITNLQVILKDAAGHVLLGRPVTWSSDKPLVVTIAPANTPATTVSAVGVGTAHVAATAAGITTGTDFGVQTIQFSSISPGILVSCGISTLSKAWCWGSGPFGDSTGQGSATPVAVAPSLSFTALSAGGTYTCGIATAGLVWCWGVGPFASTMPTFLTGAQTFASVSSGINHMCAVTTSGAAYCWGDNTVGQLGNGQSLPSATPVAVSGGITFASVSARGGTHSCGLTPAGAAYCWGDNFAGDLGTGADTTVHRTPVAVTGGVTFTKLAAGGYTTCGLDGSGAAYCWGRNEEGQLGIGSKDIVRHPAPALVVGGHQFASISTGYYFSCGVTPAGQAWCWGDNTSGQLGTGDSTASFAPVQVAGGLTWASVTVDVIHACGITTGGIAYCWGDNSNGQLGIGSLTSTTVPTRVLGQP